MALQLVLDQNGNYTYKDVAPPKTTPVLSNGGTERGLPIS